MYPVEGLVQLVNLIGATAAGAIVGALVGAALMAACIAHGWYWRF